VFRRRRRKALGGDDAPPGGQSAPHETSARRLSDEQARYILAALADLRDTTVSEVMTPRVDVVGLAIPVEAADVAKAVRESGHSCFPVYDADLDHLVGVLYVNDLFRAGWALESTNGDRPSPVDISRRLRQPYLVPESRLVLDVLAEMRRVRRTFAVVVDEYGGVAGVITVKDLLAALVGDLHDEFDPGGEPEVVRVDQNRWLIDGGTSIDDVHSQVGLPLPEGKYVTLGGYIFDALGHIPVEGERLRFGEWELRVVEMDRRRIAKVVLAKSPPAPTPTSSVPPGTASSGSASSGTASSGTASSSTASSGSASSGSSSAAGSGSNTPGASRSGAQKGPNGSEVAAPR
jgi:CBS domain containing-hemolysin-like protein